MTDDPTVTLIRGDGIGPEIAAATLQALDAAGAKLEFDEQLAGLTAVEQARDPLPQRDARVDREAPPGAEGAAGDAQGRRLSLGQRGAAAALRSLRQRPPGADLRRRAEPLRRRRPDRRAREHRGHLRRHRALRRAGPHRRRSRSRSSRATARSASCATPSSWRAREKRKKVTLVHKANILKFSNGLFLDVGREVAKEFPDIAVRRLIVDACAMKLVKDPDAARRDRHHEPVRRHPVSDLSAGLVGGLGVAPGANLGEDCAIFEAVHGTAPDIAGKGLANPTALMLAAAQLLRSRRPARRRRRGCAPASRRRWPSAETRTRDLGGRGRHQDLHRRGLPFDCLGLAAATEDHFHNRV